MPDAEPVEGPVVLPRPAGTADHVPPDGGGCDTPWLSALIAADPGAVPRQEPVEQARGAQVRDRRSTTVHLMFWAVLVMIGSFFRGPGFNFVLPWDAGLFFEL